MHISCLAGTLFTTKPPEKSMCVCRRYQHTGSLDVCRTYTGELKEPGAENRTGAPDLSSAHSGAEPRAWSRMGQPEVSFIEQGTTTHSLHLFGSLVFFQNSASLQRPSLVALGSGIPLLPTLVPLAQLIFSL